MSPRAITRRAARRSLPIPDYANDAAPVRGRCRRRACQSRWGLVRVTLDFRGDTVERFAATECARCGHVWRRVRVPALTSPQGYQRVRLTLILPATAHRWYARGRWHREGDDGIVLTDATVGDLDDAARAHAERTTRRAEAAARKRDREQAEAAAQQVRTRELLARLAAFDAEHEVAMDD